MKSINRWEKLYLNKPNIYDSYSKYQDENYRIIEYVLSNINLENKVVLELGCGSGMYTGELASRCKFLYAVDYSLPLLKIARKKHKQNNIDFIHSNITCIPLMDKSIDFIFSAFAYPPYGSENSCENEINRVIKNGGQILHANNYPKGEFIKMRGSNELIGKSNRQKWYRKNGYKLTSILKTNFCFPDYETGAKLFIEVFGDEISEYISSHKNLNIERYISIHLK